MLRPSGAISGSEAHCRSNTSSGLKGGPTGAAVAGAAVAELPAVVGSALVGLPARASTAAAPPIAALPAAAPAFAPGVAAISQATAIAAAEQRGIAAKF